tara:strand:+ start:101 stop:340 length:240 start_codon:yes stop_codon:yes gene_type:complete
MLDTHRNVRDKLHNALKDFKDINLESETARDTLIDRIIYVVRNEPTEMKYWKLSTERNDRSDGWDHYVKKMVAKGIQPD